MLKKKSRGKKKEIGGREAYLKKIGWLGSGSGQRTRPPSVFSGGWAAALGRSREKRTEAKAEDSSGSRVFG